MLKASLVGLRKVHVSKHRSYSAQLMVMQKALQKI